jgi:hypothetical protein
LRTIVLFHDELRIEISRESGRILKSIAPRFSGKQESERGVVKIPRKLPVLFGGKPDSYKALRKADKRRSTGSKRESSLRVKSLKELRVQLARRTRFDGTQMFNARIAAFDAAAPNAALTLD